MYLNNENKNQMFKLKLSSNFHPILKSRVIAQELFFESNNLIEILNNYDKQSQEKAELT